MRYLEIGSEFWETDKDVQPGKQHIFSEGERGFLCGRGALHHLILDAVESFGMQSVLLPSYCCDSMITPFIENGIGVRFYSVIYTDGELRCELPKPLEKEAIYLMPYFGYEQEDFYSDQGVSEWDVAILDATHSCFTERAYDDLPHNVKYIYASYRKWADICGYAPLKKINGEFRIPDVEKQNLAYRDVKLAAAKEKREYILNGKGEKASFLEKYGIAEEILEEDYIGYGPLEEGIDQYADLDVEHIRMVRRENAAYLIDALKAQKEIELMYKQVQEGDCPLCVPVLVKSGKRDALRRFLISKDIYCPVHWPITKYHQFSSEDETTIYQEELSLICDQRYSIGEMQRIADCIIEFFEKE